jgi:hypothetical protein
MNEPAKFINPGTAMTVDALERPAHCPACGLEQEEVSLLVREVASAAWRARDGRHDRWLEFVCALDRLRDTLKV